MNNGVNENQNTLAPMEGVKIAPASDMPVNASNGNNTQVVNAKPQEQPILIQPTQQIPQIVLPQEKKSDELRPMTNATNTSCYSTTCNSNTSTYRTKYKKEKKPNTNIIISNFSFSIFINIYT